MVVLLKTLQQDVHYYHPKSEERVGCSTVMPARREQGTLDDDHQNLTRGKPPLG